MHNHRSPTRTKTSQIPPLPPLVAPWQQEQTSPNRSHHTCSPPCNTLTSPPSSSQRAVTETEKGAVNLTTAKLENLESRLSSLEQASQLGKPPTVKAVTKDSYYREENGGEGRLLEELVKLSSEVNSRLERIEQRLSVNEQRVLAEESRVTTLVESTQEIERGILEGQQQLLSRRGEQELRLKEVRETLYQLERRQLQLGEFVRQAQDGIASQVQRVGERLQIMKRHVETISGSFGGKINALEQQHRHQEESLLATKAAVAGLEYASTEMKKQIDLRLSDVRTTLSDVHSRLVDIKKDREKQETHLEESFRQVYAQMKGNLMHLRELFARQLHENSMSTSEENARIKDDVMSAIMYSRREWVQGKENLQRELETRITALEEAMESERKTCATHMEDMCSAVRSDWEKTRTQLAKEIATTLQCGEQGRAVLQGVVSVVEEEAKVSRQEISAVLEAEIKTRQLEVCRLQLEHQKMSEEWESDRKALKRALEVMEERATADREQAERDGLVREWQEVGLQLLSDIDSRLSTVHTHIANLTLHSAQPEGDKQSDGEDGGEGKEDVLQVSQQLSFVQREQGELSQQMTLLNRALEELQIKLVGAIQRETNQRFHTVLELKNELAQLSGRMPLLAHYTHSSSPDHPKHDSLDTSHNTHNTELTPDFKQTPYLPGHHSQMETGSSPTSLLTEQGEEGDGGGCEGDEAKRDRPYNQEFSSDQSKQPPETRVQQHNPLHSKSRIILSPHRHRVEPESTDRRRGRELSNIAEGVAEAVTTQPSAEELPVSGPECSDSEREDEELDGDRPLPVSVTDSCSNLTTPDEMCGTDQSRESVNKDESHNHTPPLPDTTSLTSATNTSERERDGLVARSGTTEELHHVSNAASRGGEEEEEEEAGGGSGDDEARVIWSMGEDN